MAYSTTGRKRKKANLYERLAPLARDMHGEQRTVQDVVEKFISKGASRRNGEMMKSIPSQFANVPIGEINGMTYFWNGHYYEYMSRHLFNDYVYKFMCACDVPAEAFNMIKDIQDKCFDAVMCHKLRLQPQKFIFRNGVMDLEKREFTKAFSPDDVLISSVDYDYTACEPMAWKRFLDEVLPDKASQDTLQMFLGASLMSRREAKIEKMLVLYGGGSNGKSVIFETVKGVLGENSVSYFGVADFINENERGQSIAACNGKRLNYCSEIRAFLGRDVCDDTLKELISGEPMTVRPKYSQENIVARDLPLLMANTNWNMQRMNMSDALRRRIIQLCFNVTIPPERQDKTLHNRLREEYAGIFSWMVEGLQKLRGNEYRFPDENKLPSPKEEYVEVKKMFSTLKDVVLAYLNYKMFGYKQYGERKTPVRIGMTTFFENVREYSAKNGYTPESMTRKSVEQAFLALGGREHKSGNAKYFTVWMTLRNAKAYRRKKKEGEIDREDDGQEDTDNSQQT